MVALLFTDLVASTESLERLGDEAGQALHRVHFDALRRAVAGWRGQEVKNLGDGLMVAFLSAVDALSCAAEMQRAVERHNSDVPPSGTLSVRIGVHAGEPIREEGDYFGIPVVVAKRLCDVAGGGQILVSELVRGLVGSRAPHELLPVGRLALKGLRERLSVYELLWPSGRPDPRAKAGALPRPTSREKAGGKPIRRTPASEGSPLVQPPLPLPLLLRRRDPFVGRAEELRRLAGAWGDVGGGTLRLVCVAGEPGIGKTRVAAEFARRVHGDGAAVLYGRSDEHMLVAYQPFVEALTRYVESLDSEVGAAVLADGGQDLAPVLPSLVAGVVEPADAETQRYRAFEAARALVEAAAAHRPLLLVLDDLHWADTGTLLLLRHLARMAGGARILVLLTYRDLEAEALLTGALAHLRREHSPVELTLGGLNEDEAALLVRRPDARVLLERTRGNPLFLRELARHLEEGGAEAEIPPGVADVIRRRIERLGERAVVALTAAALMGAEFDLETLETLGGDSEDLLDVLEAATAAGLVAEGGSPGRYAFTHALVAQTLQAGPSGARRARLHRAIAAALERRHGGVPGPHAAEVARHLAAAGATGDAGRLVRWATAAAEWEVAHLAFEEAADHYATALAALGPGGDTAQRGPLLARLGETCTRAGAAERGRNAFLEAAAIARARGDVGLLARAALGAGGLGVSIVRADAALVGLLVEALERLGGEEPALEVRLKARLAVEVYYADGVRAEELSDGALETARRLDEPGTLAIALNARRLVIWSGERLEERLAVASEMVELARRAGDPEAELQGRNWRVLDLMELGRKEEAEAEVVAYAATADILGLPHYRWYVPLWQATLAGLEGRFAQADALRREAERLGRRAGDRNAELFSRVQEGWLLMEQARTDEIELDYVRANASASPGRVAWRMWLAAICAELGHRDEAQALVDGIARDDFAALPRDANWHAICELADACANLGDASRADRLYELLLPQAHLFPVMARAIGCYGSAEYFLGRLAATCGRLEEAVRHLERAVDVHDRLGIRPRASLARLRLAEVLLDHGGVVGEDADRFIAGAKAPARPGRRQAAELATTALEDFRDLAADAWCRRAERLLRRLGRRVPSRPPGRAG